MKILIVSDTHRQNGNLCKVLAKVAPGDTELAADPAMLAGLYE